jgi:hypothetical protein
MMSTSGLPANARAPAESVDLRARLLWAARLSATTTAADLLEPLLSTRATLDRMLRLIAGIDHVGFLAATSESALADAATAAGLDRQRAFPSELLSRELGDLLGCETVDTTVFRAEGVLDDGSPAAVETFLPGGVDPEVVYEWVLQGVGSHVGLRVTSADDLATATSLLEGEGFVMPAFFRHAPLRNSVEGLTAVYVDGLSDGRGVRLELCLYS